MLSDNIINVAYRLQNEIQENEFVTICNLAKEAHDLKIAHDELEEMVETLHEACEVHKKIAVAVERLMVAKSQRTLKIIRALLFCFVMMGLSLSVFAFIFVLSTQPK